MAWSGGTYTKGNNGTGGWVGDASLGIGIEAGRHDTQDNDFATGINQCLNKDGSNAATGNLNLGGFLPTNIGAGTAAAPAICAGNDVNTGIFSAAADQIGIATNGVEKIRLDSNGTITTNRTGSGTDIEITKYEAGAQGPILNLRKSKSATIGTNTIVASSDGLGEIYFWGANGTSFTNAAAIIAQVDGTPGASNDMPGRLIFSTTADGSGSATERMRIDSVGRVGIGITPFAWGTSVSPVDLKSGLGMMGLNNAAYLGSNIYWDGSLWKYKATDFATVFAQEAGGYIFYTAPSGTAGNTVTLSERMRLTQGGLLGLNTASPAYRLQLGDDSAAKPTTNTWIIASDARIKTNVVEYSKGLAEICQIRPITYDYNGKAGFAAGPGGVSIIAQEIQPIFPECVGSFKGKLEENDEQETDILNYNGHAITFALINAVKELNAKVEALEARVAELEAA